MTQTTITSQTKTEEIFNAISHGITAVASISALTILIIFGAMSDKDWSLFSALFYGISLVLLYTFSTLYHGIQHSKTKRVFNILDHCGIFLLIAGTYTPVLLVSIGGATGWTFFGIQWGLAVIGIILKTFYTGKYNLISTLMYAVMGWLIVLKIDLLKELLPIPAFWLLTAGGLAYTVGIVFYLLDKKIKLGHFIWHLFVMAGSILHFLMIALYVIN
ncbi:PAQR family membrane homeostasis protein TrhA [Algivirga pacifica]|uniref:Hemolysin III family protein n=1 Tax=Algivirga pacifica TaxID=1162670 RepID=A0ABP9DPL4_9BACT